MYIRQKQLERWHHLMTPSYKRYSSSLYHPRLLSHWNSYDTRGINPAVRKNRQPFGLFRRVFPHRWINTSRITWGLCVAETILSSIAQNRRLNKPRLITLFTIKRQYPGIHGVLCADSWNLLFCICCRIIPLLVTVKAPKRCERHKKQQFC